MLFLYYTIYYTILYSTLLYSTFPILYCNTVLYFTLLYLYYTIVYRTVLYYIYAILYYSVQDCTLLYLYYTILCRTVLYYTYTPAGRTQEGYRSHPEQSPQHQRCSTVYRVLSLWQGSAAPLVSSLITTCKMLHSLEILISLFSQRLFSCCFSH